ncbi:peptide/nickel transport system ATP-binding protein [Cohaesibacter marisflavi]|uniref:Peptide/nickel transport system ATP-binding protein n=1 Tax=Cohaesibacter marisflavi TaxID=655353 RepID=A0A1I5KK87_9HYPH|nr:ABC transporter ATP-binding protein [Cohaesibacter marisflavi]SFO85392.1 peptide/nickel transport system ATP-binding protein [Cohaesibacter marisflavi]
MPLIEAHNVTIRIPTEDGVIYAANSISFSVEAGEVFGIAGESGSGKSVLMQAITGLLPGAEITGEVLFQGQDLLKMSQKELQDLRGSHIGMVFQDPLSSLHPYFTIGSQITEMIHTHRKISAEEARALTVDMLEKVGIEDAESRFDDYPHQFSGGMRQRVMIAMALVLHPPLIIADEPTTALDVTVQVQIMDLLDEMRRTFGTTVIMITHDLGLLANIADHAMVMYAGTRLEIGATESLFSNPAHPYTLGLLKSSPSSQETGGKSLEPIQGNPPSLLDRPRACIFAERCPQVQNQCRSARPPLQKYDDGAEALCHFSAHDTQAMTVDTGLQKSASKRPIVVDVQDVRLTFHAKSMFGKKRSTEVLKGINLQIHKGETFGLVGESGCGKSTLARVIAGLIPASAGEVTLDGVPILSVTGQRWRQMRRHVQLVFQDPVGSLNPRRRIGAIIGDPFRIHDVAHGAEQKKKVQELMEMVGLNPEHYNRFPSEFSGGQRQRIGIARALALKPSLIIFDEPVSALDVSIQAQILNLMQELQRDLNLTYLFISHDLSVVRHVCDKIAVMDAGQIVELNQSDKLFAEPTHPFTRKLLDAIQDPPPLQESSARKLVETEPAAAVFDGAVMEASL